VIEADVFLDEYTTKSAIELNDAREERHDGDVV
jgi:hypothetical protein